MIEAGCSDNPGGRIKGVWISEGPLYREGNIPWLEAVGRMHPFHPAY